MTTKTDRTTKPLFARLFAIASPCLFALAACTAETAPDTADENVVASEDGLSRSSGGRAGFTCANGVCVCSKLVPNDCDDMRKKCIITSLFQLDRCLQGPLPVCTCSTWVRVSSPGETGASGGSRDVVSP
jgi:hypothetical protein